MPAFSIITQDPTIRALVQDGMLERAFHDALYPELLFRGEVEAILFPGNIGDSQIFTGKGLIKPKTRRLAPGQDPTPSSYGKEQWIATLGQLADTIDTYMPNSMVAIANLFLENAQTLGLTAGQSLNRATRDALYNAAMAGKTVADGVQVATATIRVKRLNGFTRARRPDLAAGSAVQFASVSSTNPLKIKTFSAGVGTANTVIGFTPDNPGDEVGPGTLTLSAVATTADRDPIIADDASFDVNVSGGLSIDAIGGTNTFRLENIRAAVARLRNMNVKPQASGYYHCHLDPTSESQLFSDPENQRLFTALPDSFVYQEMAIGRMLGTVFYRNNECPQPTTVDGGLTNAYDVDEAFGGEVQNANAVVIHRPLFVGMGACKEYYSDLSELLTDAGLTGKVAEPKITNDGIEVMVERTRLVFRSPLDRLQNQVAASYQFIGDWPTRTDAATGDAARYKRMVMVQHGE